MRYEPVRFASMKYKSTHVGWQSQGGGRFTIKPWHAWCRQSKPDYHILRDRLTGIENRCWTVAEAREVASKRVHREIMDADA